MVKEDCSLHVPFPILSSFRGFLSSYIFQIPAKVIKNKVSIQELTFRHVEIAFFFLTKPSLVLKLCFSWKTGQLLLVYARKHSISMNLICMYLRLLLYIIYQSICFLRMKWCLILLCILSIMPRYSICPVNLVEQLHVWSAQEWGRDKEREIVWPFRKNYREVKSKGWQNETAFSL